MTSRRHGFTLIELLLVIAIIAVLLFLAVPAVIDSLNAARERTCDSNVRQLSDAIMRYNADKIAQGEQVATWPWEYGAVSGDAICRDGSWNGSMVREDFMAYFGKPLTCPHGGAYLCDFGTDEDGNVWWRVECSGKPEGQQRHSEAKPGTVRP